MKDMKSNSYYTKNNKTKRKRFEDKYASFCIIIVNVIILISLLQIGSYLILNLWMAWRYPSKLKILKSNFDKAIHGDVAAVIAERDKISEWTGGYKYARYEPYVDYGRTEYHSDLINIDENGNRVTFNPCLDSTEKPVKIFFFGGSAAWSDGTADKYTIPSYLSKKLCNQDIAVEVINFAEQGYVNSQEIIALHQELRKGNIPDIAIFYDGFNDYISSYYNKEAGLPVNTKKRIAEFNSLLHTNFLQSISLTPAVRLAQKIIGKLAPPRVEHMSGKEILDLAEKTKRVYIENAKFVAALETAYGFEAYYFWQPILFEKDAKTEYEKKQLDHRSSDFFSKTKYDSIAEMKENIENFYSLSNLFDSMKEIIFIDTAHVTKRGNDIISDAIVAVLMESYFQQ